jgi:hypothetical protein
VTGVTASLHFALIQCVVGGPLVLSENGLAREWPSPHACRRGSYYTEFSG